MYLQIDKRTTNPTEKKNGKSYELDNLQKRKSKRPANIKRSSKAQVIRQIQSNNDSALSNYLTGINLNKSLTPLACGNVRKYSHICTGRNRK